MACLSEESWFYLSKMVISAREGGATFEEKKEEEEEGGEENFVSKPMEYNKLEKVFPVYAVGVSEPDPNLVGSVAKCGCKPGDPIWDAISEEAKLEVIDRFFPPFFLFMFCFTVFLFSLDSGSCYMIFENHAEITGNIVKKKNGIVNSPVTFSGLLLFSYCGRTGDFEGFFFGHGKEIEL